MIKKPLESELTDCISADRWKPIEPVATIGFPLLAIHVVLKARAGIGKIPMLKDVNIHIRGHAMMRVIRETLN